MTERERIRAKMSEQDRKFLDDLKAVFPNAKLRYVRFNDGETIGRAL